MAVSYKLTGKKGRRKAVKSIDISEESYSSIKRFVECGPELAEGTNAPSLSDVYSIFGGNCYGSLVSMAIESLIGSIVHSLEEKGYLSVSGEEAYFELSSIIFPMMCYTTNGDEYADTLQFFNTNEFEIFDSVKRCLKEDKAEYFISRLSEALNNDVRPAGEVATGILMYIANDSIGHEENNDIIN